MQCMDSKNIDKKEKITSDFLINPCLDEDRLLLHLSLGRITFLSYAEKKYFAKNLDSSQSLALLSIEEIQKHIHRSLSSRCVWNGAENLRQAKIALANCRRMNISVILCQDAFYPELLRQISDPPYLLFCRGNSELLTDLTRKNVSVVGTRRLTAYGKKAAYDFAYAAVMDGCNVVSGLAYGADAFAHKGAVNAFFDVMEKGGDLSALGRTIAVIPSGIDEIVPHGNKALASKILQSGGCVVSEYEPGLSVANWHYVGRNRIIAGLSPATVVIEAPTGSGALITADFAVEYNRELFFHEAVFADDAEIIARNVSLELEKEYDSGKVSKYKINNCPEKFVEAGAPVFKDYADYCRILLQTPEQRIEQMEKNDIYKKIRNNKPVQGELFG